MFLLAISGQALLMAVLYIVVAAVIFYIIWWFISWVGVPEPFLKVLKVLIGLAAVIFLINILLGLIGHPLFTW